MSRGNNNSDYFSACWRVLLLFFAIVLTVSVTYRVITWPKDMATEHAKWMRQIDKLMDECKIPGLEKCRSLIEKK